MLTEDDVEKMPTVEGRQNYLVYEHEMSVLHEHDIQADAKRNFRLHLFSHTVSSMVTW